MEAAYTVNAIAHSGDRHPPSSSLGAPSKPESTPNGPKKSNPHVRLLLELMDIDDPAPVLKYVSVERALVAKGITGILEVYATPKESLARIACLGMDGASRLHAYIRDKLFPFIQLAQDGDRVSGEKVGKVDEVVEAELEAEGKWKGKGKLVKEESKDILIEWPEEEQGPSGKEEIEEKDELPPIETLGEDDDVDDEIAIYRYEMF
jgi:hypothetical protein